VAMSTFPINSSGGLAGGQVGYLWQTGAIVSGIEASFDWMGARGSSSRTAAAPALPGITLFVNQTVSTDWLFTFAGRIGLAFGSWYPYVTAGVAATNLKYRYSYADNFPGQSGSEAAAFQSTQAGVLAGGGLEWRWDNHWSLRAEGLFINFNGIGGLGGVGTCAPTACGQGTTFVHKINFNEGIARGMVSYKF
jgi:outer membrane immunogenic protein